MRILELGLSLDETAKKYLGIYEQLIESPEGAYVTS